MGHYRLLSVGAAVLLAGAAPAPGPGQMPAHATDPAELPKVFAVAVRAADPAKSVRFYREAMGATGATAITPRETVVSFPSGVMINVIQAAPDSPKGEGVVGFVFQTADIDALAARVAAAGGTVARPPSDGKATGGVLVAFVKDPDGARIEVIQFPKK